MRPSWSIYNSTTLQGGYYKHGEYYGRGDCDGCGRCGVKKNWFKIIVAILAIEHNCWSLGKGAHGQPRDDKETFYGVDDQALYRPPRANKPR